MSIGGWWSKQSRAVRAKSIQYLLRTNGHIQGKQENGEIDHKSQLPEVSREKMLNQYLDSQWKSTESARGKR